MSNEVLKATAQKLVDYCNASREADALNELYAQDAVSAEAQPMPGADSPETKGLDGIRGKHDWWYGAHEVHASYCEGPYLHGDDRFSVKFYMDVTNKESGQRMKMSEIGEYTVKNGKIVREEFFYPAD